MDYATKYAGVDLKHVDPGDVDDPDECLWLMSQLDQIIANIDDQLSLARADVRDGIADRDPDWYTGAKRALKGAKRTRHMAQERRGLLSRAYKRVAHEHRQQLFVDAAKDLLPADVFHSIWDRVERTAVASKLGICAPTHRGDRPADGE